MVALGAAHDHIYDFLLFKLCHCIGASKGGGSEDAGPPPRNSVRGVRGSVSLLSIGLPSGAFDKNKSSICIV